jgi:hypothetical protein
MNHGTIPNPMSPEASQALLIAKAAEVIGEDVGSFRLAGTVSQGPDCDAMR